MEREDLIKIAIVDDHDLMREGLAKQLLVDKQIKVTMEAIHGLDMLHQLEKVSVLPDIAVIDLSMPKMDGFTLADELRQKFPLIRILVLTSYNSDYNISTMIHKGARGYLLKSCRPLEFRKALHDIYETGYYYSKVATEKTFLMHRDAKAIHIPDREMELLKLCCTELRYDQIAEKMGITMRTLDGCRGRLFGRLRINTRHELVLFASHSGIIDNDPSHSNNLK